MKKNFLGISLIGLLFVFVAAFGAPASTLRPSSIEKTYQLRKPLGLVRVMYVGRAPDAPERLSVECGLFKTEVPEAGLADLRSLLPAWEKVTLHQSLVPAQAPALRLQVPLPGLQGKVGEESWVEFYFDREGGVTRTLYRRLMGPEETEFYGDPWPIGSEIPAREVVAGPVQDTIRVTVLGGVHTPGTYRLRQGTTVLDALVAAGGFTRMIPFEAIVTKPGENGEPVRERRPIREMLNDLLVDGTVIFLPTCVAAGTMLQSPTGAVAVEDIRVGDLVLSYDFEGEEAVYRRVLAIAEHVVNETVQINGRLRVTPEHPIWDGNQWTFAGDLAPGTSARTPMGNEIILRVQRESGEVTVYSLGVEGTRNFFADEILVHNKF